MADQPMLGSKPDYNDDEIDLFELWDGLVEEKKSIFISFSAAILLAVIYLLVAVPTYQSTSYLLMPLQEDVQEMNSLDLLTESSSKYTPEGVFQGFLTNLSSRQIRMKIFNQYHLEQIYAPKLDGLSEDDKQIAINNALEAFGKGFSVQLPKNKSSEDPVIITLSIKTSPEKIADILNNMIQLAAEETIMQIESTILSEKSLRVKHLLERVESLRKVAKERRLDRLALLDEAIKIARNLNILTPKVAGPNAQVNGVSNQGLPLYYLGYKLLEAEKEVLSNRQNDDPFINGLRDLQENLVQFDQLTINKENVGVVRVDQAAVVPSKPEKPKSLLILVIAAVFGVMLGVFVALIRRALKKRQADKLALQSAA